MIIHYCFVFSLSFLISNIQRTFVTLLFACPMTQKLLNLVKEWGNYWKMFGDGQFYLNNRYKY